MSALSLTLLEMARAALGDAFVAVIRRLINEDHVEFAAWLAGQAVQQSVRLLIAENESSRQMAEANLQHLKVTAASRAVRLHIEFTSDVRSALNDAVDALLSAEA